MSKRFSLLLTIAAIVPAMPASAAKIDIAGKSRACPKPLPMLIGAKRCAGLPPMFVAPPR